MTKTPKTPLPSNVIPAGLGRRTLAFFVDALSFLALMFGLYYAVCVPAILNNNAYYPTNETIKTYLRKPDLIVESTVRPGTFTYAEFEDTEAAVAAGDYAYQKYVALVWNYFMEFIPANSVDYGTNFVIGLSTPSKLSTAYADVPAKNQDYGAWVYENFFGFDVSSETNLFQPSIENDFTSLPVSVKDPKENYASLRLAMYDKDSYSGHYYDAGTQLINQPKLKAMTATSDFALWTAFAPAIFGAALIVFLLLPLLIPGGKTLGKLASSIVIFDKDGKPATKPRLLLRQVFIVLGWSLLALPSSGIGLALFFAFLIIEFVFLVMTQRHLGFHDMIAKTLATDGKKAKEVPVNARPNENVVAEIAESEEPAQEAEDEESSSKN